MGGGNVESELLGCRYSIRVCWNGCGRGQSTKLGPEKFAGAPEMLSVERSEQ